MATELSPQQMEAACRLSQGQLAKDVAASLGITPQTVSQWKRLPAFLALMNTLRVERLEAARSSMQWVAQEAVENLRDLMRHADSEQVRMKAIETVLQHVGLTDPSTGLYAWGIGPTEPKAIEENWADEARREKERRLLQKSSGFGPFK